MKQHLVQVQISSKKAHFQKKIYVRTKIEAKKKHSLKRLLYFIENLNSKKPKLILVGRNNMEPCGHPCKTNSY
jgi:TFIIF-interacting CTD phosphatase-like protein